MTSSNILPCKYGHHQVSQYKIPTLGINIILHKNLIFNVKNKKSFYFMTPYDGLI